MDKGHQVYRMYDSADALIYVGMSGQGLIRFRTHQTSTDWFGRVATIKVTHFGSKLDAQIAEIEAILSEKPEINQVHKHARTMLDTLKERRAMAPEAATIGELNRLVPDQEVRTEADGYTRRGKPQNKEGSNA